MLDIDGPRGTQLRRSVVESLSRDPDIGLVSRTEIRRARGSNASRRWRAKDYREVAKMLSLDAFVVGAVRLQNRRWQLKLSVYNAQGNRVGSRRWTSRRISGLASVRRDGGRKLHSLLVPAGAPTEVQPTPKPHIRMVTPVIVETDDAPVQAEEEPADAFDEVQADRYEGFVIAALGGTLHRSLKTQAEVYERYRNPSISGNATIQEDRIYESGGIGHPELGVQVELYPGALLKRQVFPWLGVVGSFRHSVGLSSVGTPQGCPEPCADPIEVDTKESQFFAGLRGRYRFGDRARDLTVFADAGYGNFNFWLDPDDLVQLAPYEVIPSVDYRYIQASGGLSYGIVPTYLSLQVEGGYRFGLDIGQDAKEIWGVDSENEGGFTVGVTMRSDAPYIVKGMFFSLSFEYFRFMNQFQGQTLCYQGQQCDDPGGILGNNPEAWEPWPFDTSGIDDPGDINSEAINNVVGGIQDQVDDNYFRLYLAIGWSLR